MTPPSLPSSPLQLLESVERVLNFYASQERTMGFEQSLALCVRGSFQKHALHLGVDGRTKSHQGITVILILNLNVSKGFNSAAKTC